MTQGFRCMASLSSIYHKVCPACAGSCAQEAAQCGCGHRFAGDDAPAATLDEELLYEDYLKARREQAQQAAAAAPETLSSTRRAEAELRAVQADLERQRERISRLRRQTSHPPFAEKRSEAPRVRQAAEALEADLARLRRLQANPYAGPADRHIAVQAQAEAVPATPEIAPPSSLPAEEPAGAPRAAIQGPAVSEAPVRAAPVTAPAIEEVAAASEAPRPESAAPRTIGDLEVRAVARTGDRQPGAVSGQGEAPDVRAQLAAQAERAAQRLRAGSTTAECPNCTAQLAANTRRCKCGFEMPVAASLMPAVPVDPVDLSPLRELLRR